MENRIKSSKRSPEGIAKINSKKKDRRILQKNIQNAIKIYFNLTTITKDQLIEFLLSLAGLKYDSCTNSIQPLPSQSLSEGILCF